MSLHPLRWRHIWPACLVVGLGTCASAQTPTDPADNLPTIKLSPRMRVEPLHATVRPSEPAARSAAIAVDVTVMPATQVGHLPRIVAAPDARRLLSAGDHVLATPSHPAANDWQAASSRGSWRIGRAARVFRDPKTGEVLGQEIRLIGWAVTAPRTSVGAPAGDGRDNPVRLNITRVTEGVGIGDYVLSDAHMAAGSTAALSEVPPVTEAQVLAMYEPQTTLAAQHQVVVLNRGLAQHVTPGLVLSVHTSARLQGARSPPQGVRGHAQEEISAQVQVIRSFDNVAYALVLKSTDVVAIGDRVTGP